MRGKIFTIVVTRVDSALNHNVPPLGLRCGISARNITNIDKFYLKTEYFK
ncbi:hypothetical protein [Flavobacterium psychrophilum]|nr:hypothetical protein [Flavobacterium psychrophilum]MCB6042851.1 hypothetical protein [Flavobacterium psychrophilum]MCB6074843.1 hypothetical protein [Flavobacterium psychrophilum]MCB6077272.1 hypothetical protein [Flavobacterium psychrophilum]MCB6102167.1 hypothetical protein [Flavobacterium psychrophilum]MCB6124267.1 hypothetical protein [Flavobacterium psychrophilum]